jgi:hypothetical protein
VVECFRHLQEHVEVNRLVFVIYDSNKTAHGRSFTRLIS